MKEAERLKNRILYLKSFIVIYFFFMMVALILPSGDFLGKSFIENVHDIIPMTKKCPRGARFRI